MLTIYMTDVFRAQRHICAPTLVGRALNTGYFTHADAAHASNGEVDSAPQLAGPGTDDERKRDEARMPPNEQQTLVCLMSCQMRLSFTARFRPLFMRAATSSYDFGRVAFARWPAILLCARPSFARRQHDVDEARRHVMRHGRDNYTMPTR